MKSNVVCKRIRQLRVLKGISQEYIAEELGITQPSYARLEAQDSRINIERLKKIADILEISLSDLFNEKPLSSINKIAPKSDKQSIEESIDMDFEHVRFLKEEILFLRKLLNKKS
jgi:transcriptional regulator with XRE-family HTH domain